MDLAVKTPDGAVALSDAELVDVHGAALPLIVALGLAVGRMIVVHHSRRAAAHAMARGINPYAINPSAQASSQPLSNTATTLVQRVINHGH